MTEREQFEAWAKVRYAKNPHFWLRQIDDGGYSCGMADSAWEAWQAARAQSAQAVPLLTDAELAVLMPPPDIDGSKARSPNAVRLAMRAVEQAVRAKMGVSQWLPIETAPKDGTTVLCWSAEFGARESRNITYTPGSPGHADGKTDRWWEWLEPKKNWAFNWSPTHWVPLPPPPGIVGKEGA